MQRFLLKRLLAMVPTLLGISFVTFLLMDLAPGDAVLTEMYRDPGAAHIDAAQRARKAQRLRIEHGLVDAQTGEELALVVRYWRWLEHAAVLEFAGTASGSARFRDRILTALPTTILLNLLALLLALAVAVPLGSKAGMRAGGPLDRIASGGAFVVYGVPEFLIATLLLLVFCGGFSAPLLPGSGLRSADSANFSAFGRVVDLAAHLVLPVLTLAAGYGAVIYRFLRESVGRAAKSDFVLALRAFGTSESVVRRRVLRNGLSPIVTILGTMLPTLVGGTVVVERVFSLPGIGMLTTTAVGERDMPMVMALTMLISVATLGSLLLSDILQRVVDPRVQLR